MKKKKIPIAPQETTSRINGQKYIFGGEIGIWKVFSNQSRWHCEHDRIRAKCKDCNPIICEHGRIESYINQLSKRNYDGKGSPLPIHGWQC